MSSSEKTRPRYLPNDGAILPFDPDVEIPKHLSILVTDYPPELATFAPPPPPEEDMNGLGLFSGPISISYALFVLSKDWKLSVKGKTLDIWAKEYLAIGKQLLDQNRPNLSEAYADANGLKETEDDKKAVTSGDCAIANAQLAYLATSAAIFQDTRYVEELVSYLPDVLAPSEREMDEYVFGRAGYLYSLRMVAHHLPSSAALVKDAQVKVVDKITSDGAPHLEGREASEDGERIRTSWDCYGKPYLCVAHGWLGIIDQVLRTDPSPERARQFRPVLERIIKLQLPSGNWPKFLDEPGIDEQDKDAFIQWGHGAPGVLTGLIGLRKIYRDVGDKEMTMLIYDAVEKAQDVIWERGLLTKQSCLCHGASGNSLSLLDRERKATFLAYSTAEVSEKGLKDGSLEATSSPSGLHRGLAGTIWAMSEYKKGRHGIYASYNDV